MVLASGTKYELRFAREAVRGTNPAAIGTDVDTIAADIGSAGEGDFTRAAGSFVTDGFTKGQWVTTVGFTNAVNNGTFKVKAVAAGTLTVYDTADTIIVEASDAAQKVRIRMKVLRATSRNLKLEKDLLQSAEVKANRMKSVLRHGFNRVTGTPGLQLGGIDFDEILEDCMANHWDISQPTLVTGINLGIDDTTKIVDRASGSWITDGYRAGDIVVFTGFSNGANNANFRVVTVAATDLTVEDPDSVIITEAAGAGRTAAIKGQRMDLAAIHHGMVFERAWTDVLKFMRGNGIVVNQSDWSIQPASIITITLNLIGMSMQAADGNQIQTQAPTAVGTSSPYDAFVGRLFEGGSSIAVVSGLDFSVNHQRTLEGVVGSKFSPDVFEGEAVITGQMTSFFEDEVLLNKFVNETGSSIWVKLDDPNGTDFLNICFPNIKYTGEDVDPGQVGPVPLVMPFEALEDSTFATMMWIQKSTDSL